MADIAIIPSGGKDRWGDPLPPGEPILVRDVVTWPRRSDETDEGSVITGISAMLPAGSPMPDAIDAIVVGVTVQTDGITVVPGTGKRYEVVGDPGEWTWMDGEGAGIEVALQWAKG